MRLFRKRLNEVTLRWPEIRKYKGKYLWNLYNKISKGVPIELSDGSVVAIDPMAIQAINKEIFGDVHTPTGVELSKFIDADGQLKKPIDAKDGFIRKAKFNAEDNDGNTREIDLHDIEKSNVKTGVAYNKGYAAEFMMGIASAAAFMFQEEDINIDHAKLIMSEANIDYSGNVPILTYKDKIHYTTPNGKPDNFTLTIAVDKATFNKVVKDFKDGMITEILEAYFLDSVTYLRENQNFLDALNFARNDPNTNNIEASSMGTGDQKGTKVDFQLFVDGKSFKGVSLKANSKRIGQVARSQSKIDNGEFQVDLAHFLNGLFKIDLSSEIKKGPKDRFEMRDYLKKIFAKVADHINKNSSSDKGEFEIYKTIYAGIKGQATKHEEGVTVVTLGGNLAQPSYMIIDFNDQMEELFSKIQFKAWAVPEDTNKRPALFLVGHITDPELQQRLGTDKLKIFYVRSYVNVGEKVLRVVAEFQDGLGTLANMIYKENQINTVNETTSSGSIASVTGELFKPTGKKKKKNNIIRRIK